MRYVILTVEWCANRGVKIPSAARYSVDKKKVILHEEFVKPILKKDEVKSYSYDSNELFEILNSSEWTTEMI